jgi:hypothetical protein
MCQAVARWYRLDGALPPEVLARRHVALALDMLGRRPAAA